MVLYCWSPSQHVLSARRSSPANLTSLHRQALRQILLLLYIGRYRQHAMHEMRYIVIRLEASLIQPNIVFIYGAFWLCLRVRL